MKITLAKTAGFCFGVDRAVNMVYDLLKVLDGKGKKKDKAVDKVKDAQGKEVSQFQADQILIPTIDNGSKRNARRKRSVSAFRFCTVFWRVSSHKKYGFYVK